MNSSGDFSSNKIHKYADAFGTSILALSIFGGVVWFWIFAYRLVAE